MSNKNEIQRTMLSELSRNTLKPHTIKHQYMTMGFENIKIKNMMF